LEPHSGWAGFGQGCSFSPINGDGGLGDRLGAATGVTLAVVFGGSALVGLGVVALGGRLERSDRLVRSG
jgi:hypothetical protein